MEDGAEECQLCLCTYRNVSQIANFFTDTTSLNANVNQTCDEAVSSFPVTQFSCEMLQNELSLVAQ